MRVLNTSIEVSPVKTPRNETPHHEHEIISSFSDINMEELEDLLSPPRVRLVEYSISENSSPISDVSTSPIHIISTNRIRPHESTEVSIEKSKYYIK